jgi:PAS domain-containing protein/DNA-binding CsgD family transcriptional regulator
MVTIEAFSELLHVLYSAPLEQEQWQKFLALLSEHTTSHSGYFLSADTQSGLAILAEGGKEIGGTTISAYNKAYARKDPFRGALFRYSRTSNPIGVYSDEDLLPSQGLLRTELYRDLLGPANLRHGTFTILALSLRRFDAISVWRTAEEGPIGSEAKRLLELLIPHVQTVLELRRVLGTTKQRLASAEAMANASPHAIFILTRQGVIRHWNRAAQSLVRRGDGLLVADGRLTARDPKSGAELTRVLLDTTSAAVSPSASAPSRALHVYRNSGTRALQAMATPLPHSQRCDSRGELLLLVTDPDRSVSFPDEVLHALFNFTPAETEVANGLLMGYSAEEIASLRRVCASTVRQQIKSMLSKTGTSRQNEMIRLIMTLPAPVESCE